MPSSPNYKRDFKQEAKTAKKRGEQGTGSKSGSALRHVARRLMKKLGRVRKGQDVDHKTPIGRGGSNLLSNLRALSPSSNRSFSRNRNAGLRRG